MRPGINEKKLHRLTAQQDARFNVARGIFISYREAIDRSKQLRADALASSPLRDSPDYARSTARELADALNRGAKLNADKVEEKRIAGQSSAFHANMAIEYRNAARLADEAAVQFDIAAHHKTEYDRTMVEINRNAELVSALKIYSGI